MDVRLADAWMVERILLIFGMQEKADGKQTAILATCFHAGFCLACSSTLKMKATCSTENSAFNNGLQINNIFRFLGNLDTVNILRKHE
jgi:hypothetical protein